MTYNLTCRVLAPDEFRDVPRNLDPLLSALHRQWVRSEVVQHQNFNVTPMRRPKRNTLSLTVVIRWILKFRGSIKIDISKQNRSDQLFDFQIEERIFPP